MASRLLWGSSERRSRPGARGRAHGTLAGLLLLGALTPWSPASAQGAQVVAVLPFTVHSAENLAYLRSALAEMLTSRLGQLPEIVLIDRSVVQPLLGSRAEVTEEMARRIGSALRADYVVIGSLIKAGEAFSLEVKAVPARGGDPVMVFEQGQGLDAVIERMAPLAQGLARRLGG